MPENLQQNLIKCDVSSCIFPDYFNKEASSIMASSPHLSHLTLERYGQHSCHPS